MSQGGHQLKDFGEHLLNSGKAEAQRHELKVHLFRNSGHAALTLEKCGSGSKQPHVV